LKGYDSRDGTSYVQGQSQIIYGCPAEPDQANADCHIATSEDIAQGEICQGFAKPFGDPPGKVISKLIVFDCRYNNYFIVQTNYVILDDGSLLKWTYNNFGEGFQNCFIIPATIFGMVLGLVSGAMVAAARNQPRSSA